MIQAFKEEIKTAQQHLENKSVSMSGRSPGEGNGKPLQYSCLESHMDRAAWQATVHGVARIRHDLETKPPPGTQEVLENF